MDTGTTNFAHATASGAPDAPALGTTHGAGEKWPTGRKMKLITPKMDIRVAAWNVRTGHHVW